MLENYRSFPPKENALVELEEDLAPVIDKIAHFLPPEVIWDLYSGYPSQEGGISVFPYCRVDSAVINAEGNIRTLIKFESRLDNSKRKEIYDFACKLAFKALVWVEIGFEGLDNLAESDASRNWTEGVGHFLSTEERAKLIKTNGRELYDRCLRSFAEFREQHQLKDDLFSKFNLERLLDKYR